MSKQALRAIIEQENFYRKFNEEAPINIDDLYKISDENIAVANKLFESIDIRLSPEHLHCDGEITRTEAMRKYRQLTGAALQLQNMGYRVPEDCYEIETEVN